MLGLPFCWGNRLEQPGEYKWHPVLHCGNHSIRNDAWERYYYLVLGYFLKNMHTMLSDILVVFASLLSVVFSQDEATADQFQRDPKGI